MSIQWSDNSPIYRQLKDKLVGMMLDGDIKPGQTVSVEIALQETSGKAAGFAFDFH